MPSSLWGEQRMSGFRPLMSGRRIETAPSSTPARAVITFPPAHERAAD